MNGTWFVEDPNCAGPALCSFSGVIPIFAIAIIAALILYIILGYWWGWTEGKKEAVKE